MFSEHLHSPTESQQFFSRFEYWLEEEAAIRQCWITITLSILTALVSGIHRWHQKLTEQQPASSKKLKYFNDIGATVSRLRFQNDWSFKALGHYEPDARRALQLAGFDKHKRNWVKGLGKSYWLYTSPRIQTKNMKLLCLRAETFKHQLR